MNTLKSLTGAEGQIESEEIVELNELITAEQIILTCIRSRFNQSAQASVDKLKEAIRLVTVATKYNKDIKKRSMALEKILQRNQYIRLTRIEKEVLSETKNIEKRLTFILEKLAEARDILAHPDTGLRQRNLLYANFHLTAWNMLAREVFPALQTIINHVHSLVTLEQQEKRLPPG